MSRYIPAIILILLILSSCNGYKKITYLQGLTEEFPDSTFPKEKSAYHFQPGDILYITISSNDPSTDQMFNILGRTSGASFRMESGSFYILGYEIDDSGYIELPVIKKVLVKELTSEEAKEKIQKLASQYIKDPFVVVKLHTFKFTIVGEVRKPGVQEFGAHQISIFEAIAFGGDITYYGNRENILMLRSTSEGTKIFKIDLTDKDLVASESYYIQPNDIIYVSPLKSTLFRVRASDYIFVLNTITATLTLILLVLNLTK